MPSSRASSTTFASRFDMNGRISCCEARAGYGDKGEGRPDMGPSVMKGGSWRCENGEWERCEGAMERITDVFLILY